MRYNIYIICGSLDKAEDFILWACGFLKGRLNLSDVEFSFICVGSVAEFVKREVSKDVIIKLISQAYPDSGVPSVQSFFMTGYTGNVGCAEMCHSVMQDNMGESCCIFVDLSASVTKMVDISSILVEKARAAGQKTLGCLTYYLSEDLADMCKKSKAGDGLNCSCFDRFFCACNLKPTIEG